MAGEKRRTTAARGAGRVGPKNAGESLIALADRCCPRRTEGQLRLELVSPSAGRRLTPEAARALADGPVAAVVARTCEWGQLESDCNVGDYRFLVLSFSLKGEAEVYVQIWTEPEGPVLIEACSGAWNPAARPYIGASQRAALRTLGYKVAGRARNYQKEWTLSPCADARALASELVTVLADVFGYRARGPLEMTYCSESRAVVGRVFPAVATDDVGLMLRMGGCRVVKPRPAGPVPPSVRARLIHVGEPFPFTIEMKGQVGKTPATYEAMRFIMALEGGGRVSDAQLAAIGRECPFLRVFRDNGGGVLAIYDVPVAGTTVRWFLVTLHVVGVMRARAAALIDAALAAVPSSRHRGGGGGLGSEGDPDEADDADGADDEGDDGEDTGREPRQGRQAKVVVH